MARQILRRLAVAAVCGFALGAAGLAVAAAPASAAALPAGALPAAMPAHAPAPKPTKVTISGDDLGQPIAVERDKSPALFAALLEEVSYLGGAGHAAGPKEDKLGKKYTLVVEYDGKPKFTYDVYPLAEGGPRAFRPEKQPDKRKTTAAWFFGRLGMSETLRAAGVPLPERPDVVTGGIGGGRAIPEDTLPAGKDFDRLMGDMRRLVLLNGGVVLVLALLIAGIALVIRHRTR